MKKDGLLRVEDLCLHFRTNKGLVQAVDGVSFGLGRGLTLVVVGEAGCGKSSLARAILRLLPRNVHTYTGRIFLNGVDIMKLGEERFRREVRWSKLAFVPQAAINSLNPVVKVGNQVAEPLLVHRLAKTKSEAIARAREACELVGLPGDFLSRYAFELSGGMRQRAIIAMALAARPALVVLDEPTSALDVLTQANIMNLLKGIKQKFKTSFILITHDIATSSELADIAAIMYAGQVVELCNASQFYREPLHPYSQKLIASVPSLRQEKRPEFIPGQPPSLLNPPKGCRFTGRCLSRSNRCEKEPPLVEVKEGRRVKCWLYQ
ncbi:ABC transporter ATP-binding protein [Thermodesulfovibrionales bacterium]|nr:ABC transporter ATP-binding protein [Thermodesulfovibrionales bacterium]MCL0033902.1 ABC transporter ATP-binding protein [Thermodesulfovibrionales bacterium]MCL0046833.1 ABC transporter ATP-binding protein [Thermodesulfovibrionales bacterium]MCL0061657.1 ABC transporter ATP-binding protein [Thermodesulfovibrionales bacterium]MCL0068190.1 ABC transporter ATP-binding protein [Thermodesulfovibrionales bacterium]